MAADTPAIVWFRQDLRLADNPALTAAAASKRPLIFIYVLDDEAPGRWKIGGASRWWLHKSLDSLTKAVRRLGGALLLRRGAAHEVIAALARETGAGAIYWNRCYEPFAIARDTRLKQTLQGAGVQVESFNGALMFEPWEVKTKTGEAYKVFTPFWRACRQLPWRAPQAAPKKPRFYDGALAGEVLEDWRLLPTAPNWAAGFESEWTPGEAGAAAALDRFLERRLSIYADSRDLLHVDATSRLSPHLHWGEISPRQVRASLEAATTLEPGLQQNVDKFLSELGWREFSANLLFHWPSLPECNWRDRFEAFPWRDDEEGYQAWCKGRTGYPLVDAAMRELWTTGTMHNRARMVAASFLIKHLMIDWRRGEDWFWDTLLDADLANNAASWQWVAGSGADAAPYFRIFNPVAQGERYDPDGAYIRRWVPELAGLSGPAIHRPWEAGAGAGRNYPERIVDHEMARARALAAFQGL